jgi:hypothetical protein
MKCLGLFVIICLASVVLNLTTKSRAFEKDTLAQDQRLYSPNNKYFAVMQSDGNFVLYSNGQNNGRGSDHPTWASGTNGRGNGPFKVVMQTDGNLVLYDSRGQPTWASNTNGRGTQPFKLVMQDDANLVLYDKNGTPTWASNTYGKSKKRKFFK